MSAKKKTSAAKKKRKPAAAPPPPPPPPAPPTPQQEGCAIEKLNSRLNAIGQARDGLIGIETLEDMAGERHGTQREMRERVQIRVRELAQALASDWTAHEG